MECENITEEEGLEPLVYPKDDPENKVHNDEAEEALSKNVPIALWFNGLAFVGRALWNQNMLSMFVYQVANHDSRAIGYVSFAMGTMQLLSSLPAGYFADKYKRSTVIRFGVLVGLASVLLVVSAVAYKNVWFLTGAFSVVGIYWGLMTTSISALYADSLTDRQRPKYITKRYVTQKLGCVSAFSISIIMFAFSKNHWSAEDCGNVLYASQAIGMIALCIPFYLSDDNTVKGRSSQSTDTENEEETNDETSCDPEHSTPSISFTLDRTIPICIYIADVVQGVANGMSDQFYPIFFAKKLNLRPIYVQIVYIFSLGGQAGGSFVGGKIGCYLGRIQAAALLRLSGVIFMLFMILSGKEKFPAAVTCTFYVLRMISTMSTVPVTGGILMDYVPQNERGRWGRLDSSVKGCWSISSLVGGFMVHKCGIYSVFFVTLSAQIIATVPLLFLFKKLESDARR